MIFRTGESVSDSPYPGKLIILERNAMKKKLLLNGDEAIAQAAFDSGVSLGTGYPGTPSTEILEHLAAIGGRAQWAPNEKVALEVAIAPRSAMPGPSAP